MKMPTLHDILNLAISADIVSWSRINKSLSVTIDDIPADRRTVYTLELLPKHPRVELRTLSGYNHEKKRWSQYCDPSASGEMPTRAGEKALLAWIKEKAIEIRGFPYPESLHVYKQ